MLFTSFRDGLLVALPCERWLRPAVMSELQLLVPVMWAAVIWVGVGMWKDNR